MNAYTGDIFLFAGDFAPINYALCDGGLLKTADYPDLFKLLGTTYGGDGKTTFGLPDLRGRVALGAGNAVKLGDATSAAAVGTVDESVQTFDPKDPRAGTGTPATVWEWDAPAGAIEPPYAILNYLICLEGADPAIF